MSIQHMGSTAGTARYHGHIARKLPPAFPHTGTQSPT
jgi:hypothetical protein